MRWGTIASNSGTTLEWLEKVVNKNSCWLHEVRGGQNLAAGAAENPNCSANLLQSIIDWRWEDDSEPCDYSGYVRLAVINHQNCSDKLRSFLIDELFDSGEGHLILRLFSVNRLPAAVQDKAVKEIQKSKDVPTLLRFASVPGCPEELRRKLLLEHASNPKYRALVSNILSNYPSDSLWREAVDTLLVSGDENSLMAIADSNIRCWDLFDRIALDAADEVMRALAANPSCPLDIIEKLVNYSNPIIRLAAASNANATYDMWITHVSPYLVESVSNWPIVKWSIAKESLGTENLSQFDRELYLPDKFVNAIMENGPDVLKLLALLRNGVTKQQLSDYGKSKWNEDGWMYRSVVALNKTTEMELLQYLAKDEDLIVRTLAAASLESGLPNG